MEVIQQNTCKNCGAELHTLDNGTLRCPYCGSTFKIKVAEEKISPANNDDKQTIQPNHNPPAAPPGKARGNNWVGVLFLIFCIVVVIATEIHKYSGESNTHFVEDSVSTDSVINKQLKRIFGDQTKHIKKVNPDPQVVVRRSKVYTTKYETTIAITVQNKTSPDDYITYIAFSFRLFDKHGTEIAAADSNIRGGPFHLQKGESTTEEWSLANRQPKAKTIVVKLKKVEFGDTIWDY